MDEIKKISETLEKLNNNFSDFKSEVSQIKTTVHYIQENNEKEHEQIRKIIKESNDWSRENFRDLYNKSEKNSQEIIKKKSPCEQSEDRNKCPPMQVGNIEKNAITKNKVTLLWTGSVTGFLAFVKLIFDLAKIDISTFIGGK